MTMDQMEDAGLETTACLRVQLVLLHAMLLLLFNVLMERFLVIWEHLQRDAGLGTSACLMDLNAQNLHLDMFKVFLLTKMVNFIGTNKLWE